MMVVEVQVAHRLSIWEQFLHSSSLGQIGVCCWCSDSAHPGATLCWPQLSAYLAACVLLVCCAVSGNVFRMSGADFLGEVFNTLGASFSGRWAQHGKSAHD
jgi:hypothetical protein